MTELIKLVKLGQRYLSLWPNNKQLGAIFPETRLIVFCVLLQKTVPAIACLSFVVQFSYFGQDVVPRAIAMSLLIISMPYQGLIWLGYRSQQPLSVALVNWCSDIRTQMIEAGMNVRPVPSKASYMDMAQILHDAYAKLNKAFRLP